MGGHEKVARPFGTWITAVIAEVALSVPLFKNFDYLLPSEFASKDPADLLGRRVYVPFGFKRALGVVVAIKKHTETKFKLKHIQSFLDEAPLLTSAQLKLAEHLCQKTLCSLGEAVFALLPPDPKAPSPLRGEGRGEGEFPHPHPLPRGEREFILSADQKNAVETIGTALDEKEPKPFLLFGVSASGKTEIYSELIQKALTQNKAAICLGPEVGLVQQLHKYLSARLGENAVALWHGEISIRERTRLWWGMKTGDIKVVIGTRSAAFLPLKNLGLIIVDEEQDNAFKEDRKPRFHARDVAFFRGKEEHPLIVFGTSTPSLEVWRKVEEGGVRLLELKERVVGAPAPTVQIVDLTKEKMRGALSPSLFKAIADRLQKKEQTLLFINRRGFHRYARCSHCGWVARCPNCEVALTHHKKKKARPAPGSAAAESAPPPSPTDGSLDCHYCGHTQVVPEKCPQCKQAKLFLGGMGTERVEDEIVKEFPWAHVVRWDRDAAGKKGDQEKIYHQILEGPVDVIVGTQLLAQGLHFPKVTLVGVVDADGPLHVPDFRAGEKTYQLIAQVAGRAGREEIQGEALVQTKNADHYAISNAIRRDFKDFAATELSHRSDLYYPPYSSLVVVRAEGKKSKSPEDDLKQIQDWISQNEDLSLIPVLGPMPSKGQKGKKSLELTLKVPETLWADFSKGFREFLSSKKGAFTVTVDD